MKIVNKRRFTFFWTSIALIGIGIALFYNGGVILYHESTTKIGETLEQELEEFRPGHLTSVNLGPTWEFTDTAPIKNIKLNFETLVVFAGDEIEVKANADVDDPAITGIAIVVTTPDEHFVNITGKQVRELVEFERSFRRVIELVPDSIPPFQTTITIPFHLEGPVALHGFVIKGSKFEQLDTTDPIFHVYPTIQRLEAETNHEIKQHIKQEILSAKVENRNSNVIIGLTWIATAWLPIVIAADILVRLYIRPKKDDKCNHKIYR